MSFPLVRSTFGNTNRPSVRIFQDDDEQDTRVETPNNVAKAILCGACQKEDPTKLCGRCRSIKYCDADCQKKDWPEHKKVCQKVMVIEKDEELFADIQKCFQSSGLCNQVFYFKYKTDDASIPPRSFRIVNNPNGQIIRAGVLTMQARRMIAGGPSTPDSLIERIAKQFQIGFINGSIARMNNQSMFDLLANI